MEAADPKRLTRLRNEFKVELFVCFEPLNLQAA
jgi:hypothetical protein